MAGSRAQITNFEGHSSQLQICFSVHPLRLFCVKSVLRIITGMGKFTILIFHILNASSEPSTKHKSKYTRLKMSNALSESAYCMQGLTFEEIHRIDLRHITQVCKN